ncbi:putative glutamate-cysteine ligase 2 [Pseudomonas reidholzensis]|uniref:Putative glutamate--cysteine ligase 2 n=1 Tax=Pseudomonas reidholzensis TaxID=1785162 RepID=A0A383RZJ6_9PSED|nr:carboxylate-amine ligase [Pseudomonas reidholzensis]SYX91886.1 putative glutamate-cysteine ligase 2 [Pseudomonas reidholzensis]
MYRPCTFGIEEEYLLVDLGSGRLLAKPSPAVSLCCREVLGEYYADELFRCQIELASPVFDSLQQAQCFFSERRYCLEQALAEHGVGLYCAGSHPNAEWLRQRPGAAPHHRQLFTDYQYVARRSVASGLHVHVGVPAACDRIRLINSLVYWLPLLLVLSTSSPLWGGQVTGYMSYRRVLCGEWPHMGLPEPLPDWPAYQRYRALLQRSGSLAADGAFWWALRPSHRYPTVELRICDGCPQLEDALCIAGLFRHLVEACVAASNPATPVNREIHWITQENYWRALRHGRHAEFIGVHQQQPVTAEGWLAQLSHRYPPDSVDALHAFVQARRIVLEGTSADRQLACHAAASAAGLSAQQALRAVVEQVLGEACRLP